MVKMDDIQGLLKFGIVNLDKPSGPTSFQVSQFVRVLLGLKKSSHFGTLDPMVTGVLPVALGRGCKLNEFFMHSDKEYVGVMRLHEEVETEVLLKEMKKFLGVITQLPPVRSAVKRAPREREVKEFEFIERSGGGEGGKLGVGKDVLFRSSVQAGTYIRTLVNDLGLVLGGAHMLELRRVRASVFLEGDSCSLYELEAALKLSSEGDDSALKKLITPAEVAIKKVLPVVELTSDTLVQVLTGKPIHRDDVGKIPAEGKFALFKGERFLGAYRVVEEVSGIIARPEFVYN